MNTYGAFGSVTRSRDEIVVEGTADAAPSSSSVWREYEFRGKPGDVMRTPPSPDCACHLRLDRLISGSQPSQFLRGDLLVREFHSQNCWKEDLRAVLSLLRNNPFPGQPPRNVRALLYSYRFTTPAEHAESGAWWKRELRGDWLPLAPLSYPKLPPVTDRSGLDVRRRLVKPKYP